MKRVSDIDLRKLAQLREFKSGIQESFPKDELGFPLDRTICPWCLMDSQDCTVCSGTGVVCPTCRGARVLSHAGGMYPKYVGCPDCTDWSDHTAHNWGGENVAHNWPRYERSPQREIAAIEYYRRAKRPEFALAGSSDEVSDAELPF